MEDYRCNETIDLEDMIKMKAEQFCTKVKATVFWKSGRTEEIHADLRKTGDFTKAFEKKVSDFRKFPTVESVQVTKY